MGIFFLQVQRERLPPLPIINFQREVFGVEPSYSFTNRTYRMVTKKPEPRMVSIGCAAIRKNNKSLLLCLNLR